MIPDEDDEETRAHIAGLLSPFDLVLPGLAPAAGAASVAAAPSAFRRLFSRRSPDSVDPLSHIEARRDLRIGLVAADRPADIVAVVGWQGAVNIHQGTGRMSAVLRSWEDRFDAQLVQLGFDTMTLVVGRPPSSRDHALAIAAEHFAFCPDNVMQGTDTLDAYAGHILRRPTWGFWWN